MSLSSYLPFLFFSLVITFTPGVMTLFMLANGMRSNFRQLGMILLGANNAYLLAIIVFSLGLDSLLQQNIWLMRVVQVIGIAYLFYLAYKQWNKKLTSEPLKIEVTQSSSYLKLYVSGALVGLSNPTAIFLFALIFPQFIAEESNQLQQLVILSVTFLLLQFSSGSCYALCGRFIQRLLTKPTHHQMVNYVCAIVYILVAGFLIFKI
jgi:homoserine/homoserine lactone efflux protein